MATSRSARTTRSCHPKPATRWPVPERRLWACSSSTSVSGASATLVRSNDDDPRALFERALALATDVVATVRPRPARRPDAVPGLRRPPAPRAPRGRRRAGRGDRPGRRRRRRGRRSCGTCTTRSGSSAFCDAAAEAVDAWADDAVPRPRRRACRGRRVPGRATLAVYLNEVTVHTWDLARATGQHPAWDDDVVGMALDAVRVLTDVGHLTTFDAVGTTIAPGWGRSPERSPGLPAEPVAPFADPFELDAAAPSSTAWWPGTGASPDGNRPRNRPAQPEGRQ